MTYDARSWTEGKEETTTIHHVNDLTLTENGGVTVLDLRISITSNGSGERWRRSG